MHIEKPEDMANKKVATVKKSTCEKTLKELGAIVVPVIHIEAAFILLKKGEVDAVVYDAPILNHYILNEGLSWAEVTGPIFARQNYGFVIQDQSPLREGINRVLLTLKENGVYEAIHKKWFGAMED